MTGNLRQMLSDREQDVMALVVQGMHNKEIASRLFVSVETVKTHMQHISAKTGISNRVLLALRWQEQAE